MHRIATAVMDVASPHANGEAHSVLQSCSGMVTAPILLSCNLYKVDPTDDVGRQADYAYPQEESSCQLHCA